MTKPISLNNKKNLINVIIMFPCFRNKPKFIRNFTIFILSRKVTILPGTMEIIAAATSPALASYRQKQNTKLILKC